MQQDASPVKQPVKSVFDRLNKVKGSPALQDRLSKSTPVELESTSIRRPTHAIKRPIIDASQLLLETITAKVCYSIMLNSLHVMQTHS